MEPKTTLTILLHGPSGHGKSWTASSAPPPVLEIDLEGRARYLPYPNKVLWDPSASAPPAAGDWTHCIVQVHRYGQLDVVKQWLESGQHPFRSVVLDSISEAQKRFIDDLAGTQQLKDYDWGTVLRNLEGLVRDIRDCAIVPQNPVEVVAIIAGTKTTEAGRKIPLLQGQLKDTLPYLLDAVGYVYAAPGEDGQLARNMLVQPNESIDAKDDTNMLGGPVIRLGAPGFEGSTLTTIWQSIKERNTLS